MNTMFDSGPSVNLKMSDTLPPINMEPGVLAGILEDNVAFEGTPCQVPMSLVKFNDYLRMLDQIALVLVSREQTTLSNMLSHFKRWRLAPPRWS